MGRRFGYRRLDALIASKWYAQGAMTAGHNYWELDAF
jgi:hypothetical protein